jgi:hypothetical protein
MTRTLAAAVLLGGLLALGSSDLAACGDKSLAAGGIRMQRALAARYPASVLIYAPASSRLSSATRELRLQPTLRQVGHTYREVTNDSDLSPLVASGSYNILLADVADIDALQQQFDAAASRVVVVPVVYKATKAEAAQAAKHSRFVIKAPSQAVQYLHTIAGAVASRNGSARKG